jgi:hypothetical protein
MYINCGGGIFNRALASLANNPEFDSRGRFELLFAKRSALRTFKTEAQLWLVKESTLLKPQELGM